VLTRAAVSDHRCEALILKPRSGRAFPLPLWERVPSGLWSARRVRGALRSDPLTRPILVALGSTTLSHKGRGYMHSRMGERASTTVVQALS